MTDWVLIPCLKALFAEFNRIAPDRDRASDGSIGDAAHQAEVSDHNPDEVGSVPIHDADKINEVHAIDVDNNLRGDVTMETAVQFLLGRCRSGAEKRLRYVIYNRRIWSASSGWVQKAYTGASAHTEHAHFSASYDSQLEASVVSWHLDEIGDGMTKAELLAGLEEFFARDDQPAAGGITSRIGRDAGDQGVPNPFRPTKSPLWLLVGDLGRAVIALNAAMVGSNENLSEAIGQVDDQVLSGLQDAGRSPAELAQVLRGALGTDKATELGKALLSQV